MTASNSQQNASPVAPNGFCDRASSLGDSSVKKPALYRVYFNSKADAPNCWSVDQGTIASEIIVTSVQLVGVNLVSRLNFSADNVHDPKAWFEVHGTLSLNGSRAIIAGT